MLALVLVGLRHDGEEYKVIGLAGQIPRGHRYETVGLVGIAAGFGFQILTLIAQWALSVFALPLSNRDIQMHLLGLISISVMVTWLWKRRIIAKAPRALAAGLAGLAWAVTIGGFIIFLILI